MKSTFPSVPVRQYHQLPNDGPILECLFRPGATTLLFYPGSVIGPAQYEFFLNICHQTGFSVCALHLRGHGLKIRQKPVGITEMVDEGLAAQGWLLSHGHNDIVVAGHSQGGICALLHGTRSAVPAALFPVGALLPQLPQAIEATRFAPLRRKRSQILAVFNFLARKFPSMPVALPFYLSGHRLLANRLPPVLVGHGNSRISYPARFLASLFNLVLDKPLLSPLYLFSAKDDKIFTQKLVEETFSLLRAPAKKLIWLPAGGHLAIFNPWLARYYACLCACATAALGKPLHTF